MKSKSATLIKVFHRLLDTQDPDEIQKLLDQIHVLNAKLTYDQRMGVYDTVMREAREQAIRDVQTHTLNEKAQAILDEVKGMSGKIFALVPIPREKVDALRDRLQDYVQRLAREDNPLMVHQIIQATVRWLDDLPDKNLRSLGYYVLRGNLEARILGAAMLQEGTPVSVSLYSELNFAFIPSLALSMLRYSNSEGSYWTAGGGELAKAENMADLAQKIQDYQDILHFATATEAAEYTNQVREGIVYRFLAWLNESGLSVKPEITTCVNGILDINFRRPHLSGEPAPTYRVANVIYTTYSLAAEEDMEMYRSIFESQGDRMDMCPCLYDPLSEFSVFSLVTRLYQELEEVGATMPPVVEALFRIYFALGMSTSTLADDNICKWVLEVQA